MIHRLFVYIWGRVLQILYPQIKIGFNFALDSLIGICFDSIISEINLFVYLLKHNYELYRKL